MGVIYKLKPEIKDFIITTKKDDNQISCRKLSDLLNEKFQVSISKSSINALMKEFGLSLSVGRRKNIQQAALPMVIEPLTSKSEVIQEEAPKEASTPLILAGEGLKSENEGAKEKYVDLSFLILKIADYCVGGCSLISEIVTNKLQKEAGAIDIAVGQIFEREAGLMFNNELISEKMVDLTISSLPGLQLPERVFPDIDKLFQEVQYLKIIFSDNSFMYLDGQFHTLWNMNNKKYNFSVNQYEISSYVDFSVREHVPLALFMAPGDNIPPKEFMRFISEIQANNATILKLEGFNNKEVNINNTGVIFGLWPWQFVGNRKIKIIGEFEQFYFEPLEENLYFAPVDCEIVQPIDNNSVKLKGCAIKSNLNERIKLLVLSADSKCTADLEKLAKIYLNKWPNLDEAYQDFTRKKEFFNYTDTSKRSFLFEYNNLGKDGLFDLRGVIRRYLALLTVFIKWNFFSIAQEKRDILLNIKGFSGIKCALIESNDFVQAKLVQPAGGILEKETMYLMNRVNERNVYVSKKRFWIYCQKKI